MKRFLTALGTVIAIAVPAVFGWRMVHDASALTPARAGVTNVEVKSLAFSPKVVKVPVGSTVTWHFDDSVAHDIQAKDFSAPVTASGDFRHTFTAPGTYDYHCSLHPIMRGRVIVTG